MQRSRLLPLLLPLLVLVACSEQEPPTSPTSSPEPGAPVFSHTAGHKVVNSLADPGNGTCGATQCTLREAINAPGSTEISFAPGLTGAITLAAPGAGGGPLTINKKLSITGPSTRIVIRRRNTDPAFRIVQIGSSASVTLTNLTIQGGKASGSDLLGGGILNHGTLRLTNCVVAGNSATFGGGGINNFGALRLTNSRVSGNSATNSGGGIRNEGNGTVTLTTSTISDNSAGFGGGGIVQFSFATLTLTNSRVSNNSAGGGTEPGLGGGIFVLSGGATLTNSMVTRNTAGFGGGLNNSGTFLTLRNSTVSGNTATEGTGGGIQNSSPLTLTNSTVSGNTARGGGGIHNFGAVTLRNSTVARNTATQEGGGIFAAAILFGRVTLTNSLVALNSASRGPDLLNQDGGVVARFSLLGIGAGSGLRNGVNGNQVGSQRHSLDPRLGPLADNGGPTRTHALLSGSPAIDAASTPDCPTTDQRGVLRPQGAACDIGSYERK
jgi:CSLREA domain-containing protein